MPVIVAAGSDDGRREARAGPHGIGGAPSTRDSPQRRDGLHEAVDVLVRVVVHGADAHHAALFL